MDLLKNILKKLGFLFFIFLIIFEVGCLKTRSQLRKDDDSSEISSPQPVSVSRIQSKDSDISDFRDEVRRLNQRQEELERQHKDKETFEKQVQDDNKKIESRMIELEQAQANILIEIRKLQNVFAAKPEQPDSFPKGESEFKKKNYAKAIEHFSSYLQNTKAENAEDAVFLRGEAYFRLKDYKKAIVDFSKFPDQYTKSSKMPIALSKIGQSFESIGSKDDAKAFYQLLVDKYPNSAEAKKAKSKLK